MKRVFVLIAVLALLVTGAVSVLADPIHVGGSSFSFTFSPIHVGGSFTKAFSAVSTHANAYGLRAQLMGESTLLLSPIHVGGS